MAVRKIRVEGLAELSRKCDFDRQVVPILQEELRDKVGERWMRPRNKGLGSQRNTLSSTVAELSVNVQTTLHNPRNVGSSLQRALIKAGQGMAPALVRKAASRIEDGWGA